MEEGSLIATAAIGVLHGAGGGLLMGGLLVGNSAITHWVGHGWETAPHMFIGLILSIKNVSGIMSSILMSHP
jgi:hypothetical protein